MKLYHFTADIFVPEIKKKGLFKGTFPLQVEKRIIFLSNCQWLTKKESFDQPWHDKEFSTLPYDRTENRLTIRIPIRDKDGLLDWYQIQKHFGRLMLKDFDFFNDCENWFLFLGHISPQWIIDYHKKEIKS